MPAPRLWLRAVALALIPLLLAATAGGLLWLVLWLAVPGAASLHEAGPGALLVIGTLLGGRFEGAFVHVQSDGFWVVALLVPLVAGVIVARWLPARERHVLVALGLVATAGLHFGLLGGTALLEIHDPTTFQTATISWHGPGSLAFAGVTWATAWAVSRWDLARTVWWGALASALLGAAGLSFATLGAGKGVVAAASIWGALLGPNVLLMAVVGSLGAEVRMAIGTGTVTGFGDLAAEVGRWLWVVSFAGIGLLVLAAIRAEVPGDGIGFARRARDVTGGALAAVVIATAIGSPRGTTTSSSDAWVDLAGYPPAAWAPLLLLVALVLVPLLSRALRQGEEWPGAPIRVLGSTLGQAATKVRTARPTPRPPGPPAPWTPPPTSPSYAPSAPYENVQWSRPEAPASVWQAPAKPVPPPASGAETAWPPPATAQPTDYNPFEEDVAPPVSSAWSDVPPAPNDPTLGSPPSREGGG